MDAEVRELNDARTYAQLLQERRAALQAAPPAGAAAAELEELEVEPRHVEAELLLKAAVAQHHTARRRALADKQRRERLALQRVLFNALAQTDGGSGSEPAHAGDAGAHASSSAPSSSSSSSASAAAAGHPPPEAYVLQAGFQPCHACGQTYKRAEGKACVECARELCARGGQTAWDPLAGPCVELYRCGMCSQSTQLLCNDCYTAGTARGSAYWQPCSLCPEDDAAPPTFVCSKDSCVAAAECRRCTLVVCKACRPGHERACSSEE